jgi:hypothetical protein
VLNDFVHRRPAPNPRFRIPRWPWRGVAGVVAIALLCAGEVAGALGTVVAFTTAEVVFDAAELER